MASGRHRIILTTAIFSLLLPLFGARADSVIHRSLGGEPETLDPHRTFSTIEEMVERDLFEGLTTIDGAGQVVPGVAKSWDVSADGKHWVFHLREDAAWSNGEPLTAADFVYSLRRVVAPEGGLARSALFEAVVGAPDIMAGRDRDLDHLGIKAVDDRTLTIDLWRPTPMLTGDLARAQGMPIHRASRESHPNTWTRPGILVSNGPFKLVDWVPQAQITLKRNPFFHDASSVRLDEVDWLITEDASNALKRYRSGELDIANVSSEDLPWTRRMLPQDLRIEPIFGTRYLGFNLHVEPLASNLALRKALALAIDRQILNERVEADGRRSTDSLVPPDLPGYRPQSLWYHNLAMADRYAEARRLITEAGYGPDHPLRLTVLYVNDQTFRKILLAIAQMWREHLGVELILLNQEWQILLSRIRQRDFEILFVGVTDDLLDPKGLLESLRTNAEENAVGYANPAFDALLKAADEEPDSSRRLHLMERAERLLIDDVPMVPLMNPATRTLVRASLSGWRDNPISSHPSRYLRFGPAGPD